jgi:hypothetical protein
MKEVVNICAGGDPSADEATRSYPPTSGPFRRVARHIWSSQRFKVECFLTLGLSPPGAATPGPQRPGAHRSPARQKQTKQTIDCRRGVGDRAAVGNPLHRFVWIPGDLSSATPASHHRHQVAPGLSAKTGVFLKGRIKTTRSSIGSYWDR